MFIESADDARAKLAEMKETVEYLEAMLLLDDKGLIDIDNGHFFPTGDVEFSDADQAVLDSILGV
jgi:hypothetical protein